MGAEVEYLLYFLSRSEGAEGMKGRSMPPCRTVRAEKHFYFLHAAVSRAGFWIPRPLYYLSVRAL